MKQTSPTMSLQSHIHTKPNNGCNDGLLECVYKNDLDGVTTALRSNLMAWNIRNNKGTTPLMEASVLNRVDILDVLLSFKCDVNATDDDGNTALHLAVDEGNTEVVKKLVHSGRCIVDAANERGETALMKACFYDYTEMVRILLKEGDADPNVTDQAGQSALMIALREASHTAVDMLLKHGCDFSTTDSLGHSALYFAIHSPCNKTLDLAKKLVSVGYYNESDRTWILHEEKHNLFYQDDGFYADLRKQLRSFNIENLSSRKVSVESNQSRSSSRSPVISPQQASPTTPPFPMSPRLKQKIMSPEQMKFPAFPVRKVSQQENFRHATPENSPLVGRRADLIKAASFEQTSPKSSLRRPLTASYSSDSDTSPNNAPLLQQSAFSDVTHASQAHLQLNCSQAATTNPQEKHMLRPSVATQSAAILRTEEAISKSAPNSPLVTYRRQISTTIPRAGSDESMHPRKSQPKAGVQFSTQIHVIEYSSRL